MLRGAQDPARLGGALFVLAQNHEDWDSRAMSKSQVWTTKSRSGRRTRSTKIATMVASTWALVFALRGFVITSCLRGSDSSMTG
jgi:hypothetical protein